MKDYSQEFKIYLSSIKNVSDNTLESYMRDLRQFSAYIASTVDSVVKVDNELFLKYINHLQKSGKSYSTLTRVVASLRCFFDFMVSINAMKQSPVKGVKLTKKEKKLPEIITNKEVEVLLAQPDCTDIKGCRDKAMLEILYATGIKASELISLKLSNVNLNISVLHLNSSKNERIIPMYPEAVKSVSDYITKCREILVLDPQNDYLFTNLNGQPLTRQGFWKIIKQYARQAGIKKEITPHTLRHSFATHLLENGAPVKDIQAILGHSDISSTNVYLKIIKDKYAQSYKRYHPMAK